MEKNAKFQALKEFAAAVDLKLRKTREEGITEYILSDAKGERLVMEYDSNDMVDSISIYAGSHINFSQAKANYNYHTGEDS